MTLRGTQININIVRYCRMVVPRYKVERIGLVESQDRFGLAVVFDKVVEQTLTDWQITPLTLLTRFGGIIGVGKNFLWILIFFFSSIVALSKSLPKRCADDGGTELE